MTALMKRLGRALAVVGASLVVAACTDKPLPTVSTVGRSQFTLRARLQVNQPSRMASAEASARYLRTNGPAVSIAQQPLVLDSPDVQTFSLVVDLAACIADRNHQGPADSCLLVIGLIGYDASGVAVDSLIATPISVAPGRATAPFDLFFDTGNGLSVPFGATITIPGPPATPGVASGAVSFSSADPQIATVTSGGVVTGIATGSTTISATLGQTTVVTHVIVSPRPRDAISVGFQSACALDVDLQAWCWGLNGNGQLGDGTTTRRDNPTRVLAPDWLHFGQISSGLSQSCAITQLKNVYCWGNNVYGNLGNGSKTPSSVPVLVAGNVKFSTVRVSQGPFVCGIATSGLAYCWGQGKMLGTGDTLSRSTPTAVAGNLTFATLALGDLYACGLTTAGVAYCWGSNGKGELGNGTIDSTNTKPALSPVQVATGLRFTDISAGEEETCAIATSGAAYCWGGDYAGSLGTGSTAGVANALSPSPVTGGLSFTSIGVGNTTNHYYACGLTAAGAAHCWGSNNNGTLGTVAATATCLRAAGTTTGPASFRCSGTPVPVAGGNQFTAISVGGVAACGITNLHVLFCWGAIAGQGSTVPVVTTPVPMGGGGIWP